MSRYDRETVVNMDDTIHTSSTKPTREETLPCTKCGNDDAALLDNSVCCSSPYDNDMPGCAVVNVITYTTCLKCGEIFQAEFEDDVVARKLSAGRNYSGGESMKKERPSGEKEITVSDASNGKVNQEAGPLAKSKQVKDSGSEKPGSFRHTSKQAGYLCSKCGRSGPENFTVMRDQRDGAVVMQICVCGASAETGKSGNESSTESFVLDPCGFCGNQDPKLFTLQFSEDMDGSVVLRCLACKAEKDTESAPVADDGTSQSATAHSKSSSQDLNVNSIFECPCGNKQLNNFTSYSDEDNIPVDIECGDCHALLPLLNTSGNGPQTASHTADASGSKAVDPSCKEGSGAKTKKGTSLDKALGHVVSFMGFKSQEDCRQYFARYGVRCVVKRAAYTAMDFGLDTSQQMELLDSDTVMSGMGAMMGESAPDVVSLIGSKSGAFAALRQTYVEVSSLGRDVARANERRAAGGMNRERYVQLVVRRVGQSLGSIMGGTTGSLVGGLVLSVPVPIIGSIAGLTVGALLGQGVGGMVGNSVGGILGKESKDDKKEEIGDEGGPEGEEE